MNTQQPLDLDAIETRANAATPGPWCTDSWEIYQGTAYEPGMSLWIGETCRGTGSLEQDRADAAFVAAARTDVPALVETVRRLQDRVAELEAFAYGCDAEGHVLPHSSWCEPAKKTAADNDGCTCGQPWADHPQPHAMHCWTVNPPRNEVEEMRRALADRGAEIAKLIRWHGEDETTANRMRREILRLRAERDEFCNRVDTLTAVAKGNKRHVQDMFQELQKAQARIAELEQAANCQSTAAINGARCSLPVRHRGDHQTADRRNYWSDEHAAPAAAGSAAANEDTVHACPPNGSGLTPCCQRTPFELPPTDRMSSDPAAVTCRPAAANEDGDR